MNVQHACEEFLGHCRASKNLSVNTLRAYAIDLEEFRRFVGAERLVGEIDRHRLRAYLRHLFDVRKLKETSVKRRLACLKTMFRWLELDEVILISPFHRLDARIRMPHRLPRCLTHDEMTRLLAVPAGRLGLKTEGKRTPAALRRAVAKGAFDDVTALVAIEVLFCTGMRIGELAAVQVGDVDLKEGVITVNGKGSRQRRVFLPDTESIALVEAYVARRMEMRPSGQSLLITIHGHTATTQYLRKLVTEAGEAADFGRRVTPPHAAPHRGDAFAGSGSGYPIRAETAGTSKHYDHGRLH
jgi:site-specific recombinase XerD